MKKLVFISLLGISCKETQVVEGPKRDVVVYDELNEAFEGRYYFDNGGQVEMYNDYNGQISTLSNTLVFPNSNNSLANFGFPAMTKLDVINGKLNSPLNTLSGSAANAFIGNIQGNANNNVQLPSMVHININ